ncbi:MAG: sulfite exporter TauE/SafE family protein [Burkholderiales bacterium]|nr:sulfite exporter TauE/SafE family protein [Burkholderiales bacterium]
MTEPLVILAIAATFLLAGTVKGVIGLGLPSVSLGLLTATLDLTTAMALLVVPSLVTNVWQAAVGGHGRAILRRTWPFLLPATATVWIGAAALTRVDLALLSALLGALLVAYAALDLAGVRLAIAARREPWAAPLLGAANGVLAGMTGSFVVPGILYLRAIGLSREMLVQALGILFSLSTVALALALQGNRLLTPELGVASAAAVIPAVAGMVAGQRVRRRLSEARFRRVFLVAMLVLGAYIIGKAALGVR